MLALLIVEIEPGANTGFGLGHTRIGVEVDLLVFEASPQPLDEMLSMHRPLPSMLIVIPWSFRVPVKSSLVNWLPWSVLKISGRPYWESASPSASIQKSAPSVFDSRHASTARLTQSMTTTR